MIIGAVGLPSILAFILIAADLRSDLSDLQPSRVLADPATVLTGWADLKNRDGSSVRMLGYMMDMMDAYKPSPDGVQVEMFILMPEAGHFLHPAHRIPEEMVEIRLKHPVMFQYRRLVWVSGVLARTTGRPDPDKALYLMKNAVVELAEESDIVRWFKL